MDHLFEDEYYVCFTESTCNPEYVSLIQSGEFEEVVFTKNDINPARPLRFQTVNKEGERQAPEVKENIYDVHKLADILLVSKKVREILIHKIIHGMSLHQALIIDNQDNWHEGFTYLHFYDFLSCLDRDRSQFKKRQWSQNEDGYYLKVSQFALDAKVLDSINLENRLVIKMGDPLLWKPTLFHKSLVDQLVEADIKGFRFFNLKDYKPGIEGWDREELQDEEIHPVDLVSKNYS